MNLAILVGLDFLIELQRLKDAKVSDEMYLRFINAANADNDDWTPFNSTDELRTFLWDDPSYSAQMHFVATNRKKFVADIFTRIGHRRKTIAEIELNILKEWRGKGLGTKLLSRALRKIGDNVEIVRVIVSPGNREVIKYASEKGFIILQQIDLVHNLTSLKEPTVPRKYQLSVAGPNELADVTTLRSRIFGRVHRIQELQSLLSARDLRTNVIIAVVKDDEETVGYCIAQKDERRAGNVGCIVEIAVKRRHRRRGLGESLLSAGLAWLKGQGCTRTIINVRSDNAEALMLYKKVGFTPLREKAKILERV